MKSISTKLFLSLLGLTSLVLIATIGLARWSFEYGFTDYIRSLEQNRLAKMAEQMSAHYIENGGSWNRLTPGFFNRVYQADLPRNARRLPPRGATSGRPLIADDDHFGDQRHPPSPPPGAERVINNRPAGAEQGGLGPGGRGPDRRGPAGPGSDRSRGPMHPTALFDLNNQRLAGSPLPRASDRIIAVPILVDGKTVGELRTVTQRGFNNPTEQAFSSQQKWASVFIAGLCLAIAALASWFLARMLLAPILKMKLGIINLVQGDYSQRLAAQAPLRQPNAKNQDELAALLADIDQLAGTLEQNRSSRKRWLADISHELRTPVTVLSGEIEAVRDGLRPLDMNQLDSLGHEVERLKHLIDDLYELSLSDIGGLRYEFRDMDISDTLQSLVERYRSRIQDSGLKLEQNIAPGIFINGDINRLEQLFNNLISNSLNYTDAPGSLVISLQEKSKQVLIVFEDTSPSVNPDNLQQLFEPLYRAEKSRSRSSAGAGLGLTICRNIVYAHQGTINIQHSDLGGLKVSILFPGTISSK